MAKTAPSTRQAPVPGPGRRTGLDRRDVVAAALDLVVAEGPAALTMRRLAGDLGVATPTVYWHVGSREELIVEIIRCQADRLAERPVEGATGRDRVCSAARNIWASALENRAITSLAHQTGTTSLLGHRLEIVLVQELEAAGLVGKAAADAARAILIAVAGALVPALRDRSSVPEPYRAEVLWATTDAPISEDTRAALSADPDLDALSAATIRAVVDHHVPA